MVTILKFIPDTLDLMIEEEKKESENKEFENNLQFLYLENYRSYKQDRFDSKDNEPVNVIEINLY